MEVLTALKTVTQPKILEINELVGICYSPFFNSKFDLKVLPVPLLISMQNIGGV